MLRDENLSSDLLAELKNFKNSNEAQLPRERDHLKTQKKGGYKQQFDLAKMLNSKLNPIAIYSISSAIPDHAYKTLLELFNLIYDFLIENKSNELYILQSDLFNIIDKILKTIFMVLKARIAPSTSTLPEQLSLIEKHAYIACLLQNHFCIFNKKIFPTSMSSMLEESLDMYFVFNMELNRFDEIKAYLKVNKKILYQNKNSINNYLSVLERDHTTSAKVAFKSGGLQKAKMHIKKSIALCEDLSHLWGKTNHEIPILLKQFAVFSAKEGNYLDALYYSESALDFLAPLVAMYSSSPIISNPQFTNQLAQLVSDEKFLRLLIANLKEKQKIHINAEVEKLFPIEWHSAVQFSIQFNHNSKETLNLVSKLNKANIVCFYDDKSQKIVFSDYLDINVESLKRVISSWQNKINNQIRLQQIEIAIDAAETVTLIPYQKTVIPEVTSEPTIKKEKKEKPVVQTTAVASTTETNNEISWGDDYPAYKKNSETTVYKLFGPTAHNQYLYLNRGFFSKLNIENPDAARTLVNICNRGKVINDSTGNKGIIIEGNDVKIKDSSKAYRFFGRRVASTQHNNKTCQLIEINDWHPDPH